VLRPAKRIHAVFIEPRFPGHFDGVIRWMLERERASVSFVCETVARPPPQGVRIVPYAPDPQGATGRPYFFSRYFESDARSMYGVYRAVDDASLGSAHLFVGHAPSGTLALLRSAFPAVPAVALFDFFHQPGDSRVDREEYPPGPEHQLRAPLRNATQLLELQLCTRGYVGTPYQKSTFPEPYHHKLDVRWEPLDTALFAPGPPTGALEIPWPAGTRLVTFVARGLEASRGFDVFVEVAARVAERLEDVHFAIAGAPETFLGHELAHIQERSFKEHVLQRRPLPPERVHFLDVLPEDAVADLLKLSSCHFHWTVPYPLTRSAIQAAASGALIVASSTAPVRDLLEHGYSGLLFEPFDLDDATRLVLDALEDPTRYRPLREGARRTAVARHAWDTAAGRIADLLTSVARPA
jgi:glycosyltransferase involved in cell wall biosynthesis